MKHFLVFIVLFATLTSCGDKDGSYVILSPVGTDADSSINTTPWLTHLGNITKESGGIIQEVMSALAALLIPVEMFIAREIHSEQWPKQMVAPVMPL